MLGVVTKVVAVSLPTQDAGAHPWSHSVCRRNEGSPGNMGAAVMCGIWVSC